MSRGGDTDSSSSSSDEGSNVSELDAEFLQALALIKQKDPTIYNSNQFLFNPGNDGEDAPDPASEDTDHNIRKQQPSDPSGPDRKSKPKFLRQVLAEQALHDSNASDQQDTAKQPRRPKTYHEEQSNFKDQFLQAANAVEDGVDDSGFGHVLSKRAKISTTGTSAGVEHADATVRELLVKCFGSEEQEQDPSNAFLRDYMQRQAWRSGANDEASPLPKEPLANDLDEDLEHTEEAERFEAKFNFRFEEPGSSHTITYPRELEGTVRKKDERRKLARQRKALRQAEEDRRQAEEAKRLRKAERRAKFAEQQALAPPDRDDHKIASLDPLSKVAELRQASGTAGPDDDKLLALLADEDFDPAAYDAAMASAFDGDYYKVREDLAGVDGEELPDDGVQDTDAAWEAEQEAAASVQPPDASSDSDADENGMLPAVRDGGFRYRKVAKADYGLSVEEMLTMDPKELNQVISVKRLAPYRNDRYTARPNWQKMQELRDEKAAVVAARKPRNSKTKHKLRSHEKAELYAREAAEGGSQRAAATSGAGGKAGGRTAARKQISGPKSDNKTARHADMNKRASKTEGVSSAGNGAAPSMDSDHRSAAAASNDVKVSPSAVAPMDTAAKKAREQERRLQSYRKLTLRKDGPSAGNKKRTAAESGMTEGGDTAPDSGLGKQAKKRLKRSAKRAAARVAL